MSKSLEAGRPERRGPTRPPKGPRRSRGLQGASPPPGSDIWRALRSAGDWVIENCEKCWSREALTKADVAALLEQLLVLTGSPDAQPDGTAGLEPAQNGAQKALLSRFIDLVRQQLLDDPRELADHALLDLIRKLGAAQATLEPEWHQSMSAQLTGASALDLVVEVAHDLRSPLTSIMFLSETIRKGQSGSVNNVQRQQLGIIYSASLGLVSLANDLMDLAKERSEGAAWRASQPEPFSIEQLLDDVRGMVGPMAEEKRLDLTFFTPDHDLRLGSPLPLSRVLLNLMTNAIKFTERGSVEVVAREVHHRNCLEFSVRDTGRGMEDAEVQRLYEPFRRGHSQTGFRLSETGLGLSICRRMVELMGGRLQVETKPQEGTRFFFELNLPRARRG